MKKAYLLLSGCGNRDGSEIHEAVLCMLSLEKNNISYQCIGPDIPQARVINHYTGTPESAPRQAIVEAARIARGNIIPIEKADANNADLLVIPGGLGAAMTLSTYAKAKENASVLSSVNSLIQAFYSAQKPIVATCIGPVLLALSLRNKNIAITLGTSSDDAAWLTQMGMDAKACSSDSFVLDEKHKIATTPAYMEQTSPYVMWKGIDGAITAAATLS